MPRMNLPETSSTRPYLIRAIHEWCTDNGFTPYLAVRVDSTVDVPREYVKDGEIVLNVSYDATGGLQLGNDLITFKARFGGRARDIVVPVERVMAIYARENGQGMAFPLSADMQDDGLAADALHTPGAAPDKPGASADRVIQLVSSDARDGEAQDTDEPPEPPRPAGAGVRPALKRIK